MSNRSSLCCTARKRWCTPMPATPARRIVSSARDCEEGNPQGEYPCAGGASVPGDQAPVWSAQGTVSRLGQEHGPRDHVVRAVEPVDGAQAAAGHDRNISSAVCEMREIGDLNSMKKRRIS